MLGEVWEGTPHGVRVSVNRDSEGHMSYGHDIEGHWEEQLAVEFGPDALEASSSESLGKTQAGFRLDCRR